MRASITLLLFLALFAGWSCKKSSPLEVGGEKTAWQFHIYGVITDAATGAPVAGATIGLRDPNVPASSFFLGDSVDLSKVDTAVAVKTTAADGSFDLVYAAGSVDTAKYQLLFASKSGYTVWRYDASPVHPSAVNDTTTTISLRMAVLPRVRFHIKGLVVNATTGLPVAGATIGFRSADAAASAFFVGDSVDLSKTDGTIPLQVSSAGDRVFDLVYTAKARDTVQYQRLFAWKSGFSPWRYDTTPVTRTIQNDSTEVMTIRIQESEKLKTLDYFPLEVGRQWTYYHQYNYSTHTPYYDPNFTPTVVHEAGTTTWTVKSIDESGGTKTCTIDAQYVDSTDATRNAQGSFQILEAADHRITVSSAPQGGYLMAGVAASLLADHPFYRFHSSSDPLKILAAGGSPYMYITRSTGISTVAGGINANTYSISDQYQLLSFK